MWWTSSSGRIELKLSSNEANSVFTPGRDATPEVEDLINKPHIRKQLDKLKPKDVSDELSEYGAWDDDELADHEENLKRLLWIAGNDINENEEE